MKSIRTSLSVLALLVAGVVQHASAATFLSLSIYGARVAGSATLAAGAGPSSGASGRWR